MGSYRYLLAVLVVLSHSGVSFFGYNPGIIAVISFLMISGYVITKLINKYYNNIGLIPSFYVDRALRLFPQFLLYLSITVLVMIYFGDTKNISSPLLMISNIAMIPLNFFTVYKYSWIFVPQSWSLGLEAQFYLAIPFILIFRKTKFALILSIFLFTLAFFNIIRNDYYTYRMLSGSLCIFLLGNMITTRSGRKMAAWCYAYFFSLFILSFFLGSAREDFLRNGNVLLGILVGLPIVWFLTEKQFHRYDAILGNISYGLYLNHFIFIYIMQKTGLNANSITSILVTLFFGTIISFATQRAIEQPIYKLRHKFRKNHSDVVGVENSPSL